ncbi:MAG: SulP family inorganic anion transporter [Pseudomonadota bacterium]
MKHPLIPRLDTLRGANSRSLLADGIAGTTLAILLIPQVMAYAQLAGLPPETGLYAALVPPLLYLLFGTSPYVSIGPVALVSLVIASVAGGVDAPPSEVAVIVGIQAGLVLAMIGALKLGRLVNFISEPVLLGFTAAVAFLIFASQFPTLLGVDADRAGNLPVAVMSFADAAPRWHKSTALVGAAALLLLIASSRFAVPIAERLGLASPWKQAAAKSVPLVIIIGCAIAAHIAFPDVARVQAPPEGLPPVTVPTFEPSVWIAVLPSSLVVAVIIFATATAVAKSLAGKDRSGFDTNREAAALGLGNIAASLTGGYAVSASLSRSALVEESGGRTPMSHVVGAGWVLVALLFFAPMLAFLPKTVLAALVISAVFSLVKVVEMRRVWRHDRSEAALIALTFVATLGLGVKLGLAIGAGAALAHHMWVASLPRVTLVGTDDSGKTFRSIEREEIDLHTLPVLIIRIDRSIWFANSAYVEDQITALVGQYDDVCDIVFDMRAANIVDASGAAMLRRLVDQLTSQDVEVHFAAVHEPVQKVLGDVEGDFYRRVKEALEDCKPPVADIIPQAERD